MFHRILPLLVVVLFVHAASAWNKPGHMTSGAIAYAELKSRNPKVLEKAMAVLREHPHFPEWQPVIALMPAEDQDLYVFMKAARWPDDARGDDNFGGKARDPWHYINFPFVPEGEADKVKLKKELSVNILTQFEANRKKAINQSLDMEERAVALCWVFHLVGDVHQPLHTSALFSSQFPKGDRGGTLFFIKKTPQSKTTMHLHSYWDSRILENSDKPKTVKNKSAEIRKKHPREDLEEVSEKSFPKWADESFELAKKVAYRNGKLQGTTDEENGTPLPKGYAEEAQQVAYRRMALAGYRLADLLEEWFKE